MMKYETIVKSDYNSDRYDCVICDIDGTLAINQDRDIYDYDNVINDYADPRLLRILNNYLHNGTKVFFITGRENNDKCRKCTSGWLKKLFKGHEYIFDYSLLMRNLQDCRPDEVVKQEIYNDYIKNHYNVICVFEDKQSVVDMWRKEGLLCCQVANNI